MMKAMNNSEKVVAMSLSPTQDAGETNIIDFIDPIIEKRIRRKLDFIIIPILTLTYLFKYATSYG